MKHIHRVAAYLCLLATTIFVMSGCGTSYMVTPSSGGGDYSYNDLNSEFLEKEAVIELNEGRKMHARQIRVDSDSISWNGSMNGDHYRVAAGEVKRITRSNHIVGGLEGLGFGLLADGAVLGAILSDSGHDFPLGGFFVLLALPPLVAVLGAVIGHQYEYSFPVDSTNAKQK